MQDHHDYHLCFQPDPDHPREERLGEFPPLLPSPPPLSHLPSRPYVHLVKIGVSFLLLNYSTALILSQYLLVWFQANPRQLKLWLLRYVSVGHQQLQTWTGNWRNLTQNVLPGTSLVMAKLKRDVIPHQLLTIDFSIEDIWLSTPLYVFHVPL